MTATLALLGSWFAVAQAQSLDGWVERLDARGIDPAAAVWCAPLG